MKAPKGRDALPMEAAVHGGPVLFNRIGVQPIDESDDFHKCEACGDMRGLGGAQSRRQAAVAAQISPNEIAHCVRWQTDACNYRITNKEGR